MTSRPFYRQTPAVLGVEERTEAGGSRLPAGWLKLATELVRKFHRDGKHFTTADLRRAGLPEPDHPNHWGSLLAHLQAIRAVRPVGLKIEPQPGAGSRPVRVWTGMDETTE